MDFEKVCDYVDYKFLILVIEKMGFHEKWTKWIKKSLNLSIVSVLVNRSPKKEFKMSRGLRQEGVHFVLDEGKVINLPKVYFLLCK